MDITAGLFAIANFCLQGDKVRKRKRERERERERDRKRKRKSENCVQGKESKERDIRGRSGIAT